MNHSDRQLWFTLFTAELVRLAPEHLPAGWRVGVDFEGGIVMASDRPQPRAAFALTGEDMELPAAAAARAAAPRLGELCRGLTASAVIGENDEWKDSR